MKAQGSYDIPTIAARLGMSNYRAAHFLERNGVKVYAGGKGCPRTILLSDLRAAFPDLYASLEELAHLHRITG